MGRKKSSKSARWSRVSLEMACNCSADSRDMWVPATNCLVMSSSRSVASMMVPVLAANVSISATRSRRKPMFSPIFVPVEPERVGQRSVFQRSTVGPGDTLRQCDPRRADDGLGDAVQRDHVGGIAHIVIRLHVHDVVVEPALREVLVGGGVAGARLDACRCEIPVVVTHLVGRPDPTCTAE